MIDYTENKNCWLDLLITILLIEHIEEYLN